MVKQKVDIGVFRHGECKSGLYFRLALLLYKVLATFCRFPLNAKFLGKTRQSDFPEYPPLCKEDLLKCYEITQCASLADVKKTVIHHA